MSTPDPQDSLSPLYVFVDTNPSSSAPNNLDSSPSHFTDRQYVPEVITRANPIIVTITAHGLANSLSLRASKFVTLPFLSATGMEQLNNRTFYVQHATTNTFQLYNVKGLPVDGSSYTAYITGGQFTLGGTGVLCVNPSNFPPAGIPEFPPA